MKLRAWTREPIRRQLREESVTATKQVFNVAVALDDGTGACHEGDLWLVTGWIVSQEPPIASPERMIRVGWDGIQKVSGWRS